MSIMFANRSQQPDGAGYLYEFQAGRTLIEPGSTPEKRKAVASPAPGLVYVKHSQDDQLLHFCWKNRQSNNTELDLIIFPGETEFLRINECKDGRVFMLKFKTSQERHLFWMQEPAEDKDEEVKKKVNEFLSNAPPTRTPLARAADRSQLASALNPAAAAVNPTALSNALGGNADELGPFGNMDQNQLMRLISMMNGGATATDLLPHLGQLQAVPRTDAAATTTPIGSISAIGHRGQIAGQPGTGSKEGTPGPTAGADGAAPVVTQNMLSQIISSLGPSTGSSTGQQKRPVVDLSSVLTRNNTREVVTKYSDQLSPLVPDQQPHQSAEAELNETVGNPQFQQAADFLGSALQLGQLSSALEQFQLNKGVVEAAKKGDLVQFAEKLSAQEDPKGAVDRQIEQEADAEENVETMLKKEVAAKKETEQKPAVKKPPPHDDNMELD